MQPTSPTAFGERGSASSRSRPLPTRATSPSSRSAPASRSTAPWRRTTRSTRLCVTPWSRPRATKGFRYPTSGSGAPPSPPAPAAWCCVTPLAWSSTASTTAASSTHGPRRVTMPPPERGRVAGAGRGGFGGGFGGPAGPAGTPAASAPNRSSGRFPDGLDTDSNCTDFLLQPATTLSAASAAGATNIKVASVADFGAGQTIMIDTGANLETAVIATVGTAGATTVGAATNVGATVIPVASGAGFSAGQTIAIDSGANHETAVVASTTGGGRGGGGAR